MSAAIWRILWKFQINYGGGYSTARKEIMEEIISKYPIGSKVILDDSDSEYEVYEVVGYKKIKDNYYLLFKNGGMVVM